MELTEYLRIARRWWWLLVAAPLLGAVVAYLVSTRIPPTYRATATLLVVQRQASGVVQLNDIQTSQQLANTFSSLITLRPVLQQAIDNGKLPLDVDHLQQKISVSNPRSTQLLEVSAEDRSPQLASTIANTVSETFINSNQSDLSSRPGVVSIVERAVPPQAPVSPRKTVNAALGGILALMAVSGLVLLVEYLDDTVKTGEDVAEATGLSTVGRVEEFGKTKFPGAQLPAANSPRSTVAEAYRATRTGLSHALSLGESREKKVVLFTSPGTTEGKTTTVGNLAVVFGLAGLRVCVIDADLRRPVQHRLFGLDNAEGLTTLLAGRGAEAERTVHRTAYPNVSVLTSGPVPANPSELLGSTRMKQVLSQLRARFDLLLIDSPPILAVTDASVLATEVDATVLVVRGGKTRTPALRAAVEDLALSGHPLAGVVINRVQRKHTAYYHSEYRQAYVDSTRERLDRVRGDAQLARRAEAGEPEAAPPVETNGNGAVHLERDERELRRAEREINGVAARRPVPADPDAESGSDAEPAPPASTRPPPTATP